MTNNELIEKLRSISQRVFDNEDKFMERFYVPLYGVQWSEIVDFAISEEVCRASILLIDGPIVLCTFNTVEVLDWIDEL